MIIGVVTEGGIGIHSACALIGPGWCLARQMMDELRICFAKCGEILSEREIV